MLGEMNLVSGSIQKRGKIAYVSQMVWLRNATIRDNITFGLPYDEHRFSKTIKICQLEDDLKNLSGGDMTEVGERGINLSGG
jgi:ABC-type multidrug transport system fused ATPase/permease subunit